jgi:hypothetical protein
MSCIDMARVDLDDDVLERVLQSIIDHEGCGLEQACCLLWHFETVMEIPPNETVQH